MTKSAYVCMPAGAGGHADAILRCSMFCLADALMNGSLHAGRSLVNIVYVRELPRVHPPIKWRHSYAMPWACRTMRLKQGGIRKYSVSCYVFGPSGKGLIDDDVFTMRHGNTTAFRPTMGESIQLAA